MVRRCLLPLLLLPALLGVLAAAAQGDGGAGDPLAASIDENTRALATLRQRMADQRARLESIDSREAEVRRTYDEVATEIEETNRILGEMASRERALLQQSDSLAVRLQVRHDEYEAQRQALGRHLRRMHIRGQEEDLRAVLTAASVSQFMTRMQLNRTVARVQASLVQRTRTQGRALVAEQRLLDTALAQIWEARAEAGDQTGRLEMLQAERSAALRELAVERQDIKNAMLALDLNEQKLTYLLEDLERQRQTRAWRPDTLAAAPNELVQLAGQLDWPVRGTVARGFGRSVHPRFKTVTLNNGLNIAAEAGAPVAAVAAGRVEFQDDLPGFGRCVILDHGEGYYTLYAHLDRVYVAAGADIARGQILAEVGRPAAGEDSQLYFEVRHGRTPLDPADWLRSR
jgi:septal ring factor EnvC (AmiA/AmiB activator)